MGSLYNRVKVNNPGHSFFNLSHDKKFDCDMGQLIPIDYKFVMPGDVLKFGNEIVARMQPLVAPTMHEVNIYTQYFFVPLRIMFGYMKSHSYPSGSGTVSVDEWEVNDHDLETFLTGGKTGYDTSVSLPVVTQAMVGQNGGFVANDCAVHDITYDSDTGVYSNCTLVPTGSVLTRGYTYIYNDNGTTKYYSPQTDGVVSAQNYYLPIYLNEHTFTYTTYSLWDYLEFPVTIYPNDFKPSAFPFRAYNLIWNNFFRCQQTMDEIAVDSSMIVKNVCWNKDYFTAAYTELQRGQSPALPLSNSLLPVWVDTSASGDLADAGNLVGVRSTGSLGSGFSIGSIGANGNLYGTTGDGISGYTTQVPFQVDASGLFNVNDLRLAMRVQEWLETNLRVGTHLNEFLIGHFGIGPNDETLQRPVYLGGSKSPVIVSEVLQTSSTDQTSPQGNMAGHGITADRNYIGSYHAKEFGVFMGVMYIRPKSTYQQGINRSWLYQNKYDFPFPEFAHLGNQAIYEMELFAQHMTGNVDANGNPVVFGYTERYNELRSSQSTVCGGMRNTFNFWHLGRIFSNAPNLNADFVRCVPDKRIFAVPSEPGFICNVGNILHAYRPIPVHGEPRT